MKKKIMFFMGVFGIDLIIGLTACGDNVGKGMVSSQDSTVEKTVYSEETNGKNDVSDSTSLEEGLDIIIVPPILSNERFEAYLGKMNEDDAYFIEQCYKKFDITSETQNKRVDIEEVKKMYPKYETEVIWVPRSLKIKILKKVSEIFINAGYTEEEYWEDCKDAPYWVNPLNSGDSED